MTTATDAHIVVGMDGSPGSDAALDYACDEAAFRRLGVVAVAAWTPPDLWITHEGLVPPAAELQHAALEAAREQVARLSEAGPGAARRPWRSPSRPRRARRPRSSSATPTGPRCSWSATAGAVPSPAGSSARWA
jgi:nucleotide-binding universal stress UspA family protein